MSKGRKRPSSIEGQFAPRLIEMLQSSPWRTMSLSGRKVVERIEIEFAQHGGEAGGENGRLPVTYDDFVRYGMDRQCVGPAIREAEALGFIVITRRGRAGNAEWRLPTLFRLTFRPAKGIPGNGCSHEWRAIETMEQATILAKAARAQGAATMVVGRRRSRLAELAHGSVSSRLRRLLPAAAVEEVRKP